MDKLWCYDFVARHEKRDGFDENTGSTPDVVSKDPGVILLHRAWHIGQKLGFKSQAQQVRQTLRLALAVLLFIAFAGGLSAALTSLGDPGVPVNVIWSLGSLLLIPTITFIVWLITLRMDNRPWWGSAWEMLAKRWLRRFGALDAWQAWLATQRQQRTLRWQLGLISHLAWLSFLVAVLFTLITAFSLRHYTFFWETTWLSTDAFVVMAIAIGDASSWLGLSMPDAATVKASGNQPSTLPELREQWANWLVGSILVLGILPRLLAIAWCLLTITHRQRRAVVDITTPYARNVLAQWRRAQPFLEDDGPAGKTDRWQRSPIKTQSNNQGSQSLTAVAGLDLAQMPSWAQTLAGPGLVNSRETRASALAWLEEHPETRLVMLVDAGQTPDRGLLAFAQTLAGLAHTSRVTLLPRTHGPDRHDLWVQTLSKAGLGKPLPLDQAQEALLRSVGEDHETA